MSKKRKRGSERMLNEIEASQLSGIEFKELVIRKLKELNRITKNYREITMNSLQTTST